VPGTSRYNLRSRVSSPTEPASDLGAEVKRLAGISARNRAKVIRMIQQSARHQPNLVSSDDD